MAEIALGQKEYSRAFKLILDVKMSPLDCTQTAELSLAYLGLGQVEAARKSLGAYLGTNNRVVFYDECSKYLLPKWQTAGARDLEGIARFIIAVKPAATPLDFDERIHALKLYKGVSSSSGAYNYAEARLEEEFGRTEAAYDYFSKIGATGYKELDDDVTARMGILHRVIEAKKYSNTSTGQSGS